jgi:hypothetical protein
MPFDATPSPAINPDSIPYFTTEATLRRALQIIEHKGWCQGALARDQYGISANCSINAYSVCMMGALHMALPGHSDVEAVAFGAAADALCNVIHDSVPHWNDKAGRTKDEVIAAYREAIEIAKRETVHAV